MEREARDMLVKDEMYKEIQKLRETIFQLRKYGESLIEVKTIFGIPAPISSRIGEKILLIIRGSTPLPSTAPSTRIDEND